MPAPDFVLASSPRPNCARRGRRRAGGGKVLGAGTAILVASLALLSSSGCRGHAHGPGQIHGRAVPETVVAEREAAQAAAAAAVSGGGAPERQILFGDLHSHTTWSADASMMSLPLMQGEGVHTVADACDFARYCSALDFWAVTDHAESLTPRRWRKTVDSIRRCNAPAGGSRSPDVVAYLGWEWTHIGLTADEHYGHRSVILRDLETGKIPARPIAAGAFSGQVMRDKLPWTVRYLLPLVEWRNRDRYLDFLDYWQQSREVEDCPTGADVREVTEDCMDFARTPAQLLEKLRQWGGESLVIPHGTTWGIYTPPGYYLDRSLRAPQHDDDRQPLVEIFSGNGNTEHYRTWTESAVDQEGHLVCPEPTSEYEPCCWRAGEIIRARCVDPATDECRARVEDARRNYLAAGASGRLTVAGADIAAWKDCGQCRDCFAPTFAMRPGGSVQYALALTDFGDPDRLRRFRFGFVGGSDSHTARPGNGYKEFARQEMTETFGPKSAFWRERVRPVGEPDPESEAIDPKNNRFERFQLLDFERNSSFAYTGGLAAVHAASRSREAIWDALQRREVYATSGERILLWFDLLQPGAAVAPMGSSVASSRTPRFRVRAVGSPVQKPGCPDFASAGLGASRLAELCLGECYNPTGERHPVVRIEVVRIRPQVRPGEPIGDLVEDPWKTIDCPAGNGGCVAEFEDDSFAAGRRDTLYYVRAIQAPTPAVNAAGLRCRAGSAGPCDEVEPCYGDWRTPYDDDCLAPNEERAWSSPIYLAWSAGADDRRSSNSR